MSQIRRSRLYFCMELDRWRGSESEQHGELHETLAPVGKRSLTSRLGAPALVLRVEDVTVARALGEAIRGGRGPIQRDAEPGRDGNGVAANAEAAVERAASGSGEPLRADLRERFEASLGADLSAVRVHRGAASAEASHAVGAKAYTVGNDIHFSEGRYQPDDPFGLHLLAHEVAHTVQQSGGAVARQHKLEVSTPADALEGEADRAADAMVRGARATVSGGGAQLAREKGDGEKGERVDEKGPWTAPTADTVPHESVDPRVRKEKPASADKVWNPPPPVGWHYFPNGKTPPVAGVQLCTAQKTRPLGTFIQVLIDGQLWAVRTEWHNFTTKFDADKKPYNVPGVYQGANLMQPDQQPAELPKGPDLGKKGAPAPKRQNKLEVSGPVDASEVEADRAADTMVRGARAVVSGGGAHLARDYGGVDPDAGPAEKKVEGVRYARADGTKVYDRAGKKQTEVETLSMGAEVKLLTEGGGYYKCTTQVGNTGYVTTGSVSETRPEKKEEKKEERKEEKAPDKADDKAATPDKVDKNGPWTPPKPTSYPDESIDPRVPTKEPASPKDVWNPSPPVGYEYIPTDKSPPGSHDLATKSLSKPVGTFIQTILNGKLVGVRTEYHAGNLVKEGDKWVVKNVVKKGVSLMMATEQPKDLPKTADGDKKADPGATRRQNKLEVSGPVDASELEADRAADAMVRGQRAPIASAPTLLARDYDGMNPDAGPPETKREPAVKAYINADGTEMLDRVGQRSKAIATLTKDVEITITHDAGSYYKCTTSAAKEPGYVLRSRVDLEKKAAPADKDKEASKDGAKAPGTAPLKRPNGLQEIIDVFGKPGTNLGMHEIKCGKGGKPKQVYCHNKIAPLLKAVFDNIVADGKGEHIHYFDGCYNERDKVGGQGKSVHAWGIACDVNPEGNGRVPSDTPADKVPVSESQKIIAPYFEAQGFVWGKAFGDSMHFQYCTGY